MGNRLFGKREVKISMVGLDGAGKTTILYRLKLGKEVTCIPTVGGMNIEKIGYKNYNFDIWDFGSENKLKRHYFQKSHGVILVVDSTDHDRLDEVKDELIKTTAENDLRNAALLIFANKQDLPNAMSAAEITDKLGLHSLRGRDWYIQATCATSGDGLYEGLDWLLNQLKNRDS